MTQSPPTGELVASITGIASQLERMASGSAFVQDGFVRVLDPPYLIDKLRATAEAITTLERELEEARARFEKHSDYSIQLQRIIEAIYHNRELRPDSAELHHHKMAVKYMSASQAEVEKLKEALGQHERLLLINKVRKAAEEVAPLWLEAADAASDLVRAALQVEESKG